MEYRKFGSTDLNTSIIGFGAWAIGGPAFAGKVPIGWGNINDNESEKALKKAFSVGINFFDTADFYGFGHSEELLGKVFSNSKDVIIASKVGHRINNRQEIVLDYSKEYIIQSCDASLKRLKRDTIDIYQLHSAKLNHLKQGECIEALSILKEKGKIRYWGISLNTFKPEVEGEFLLNNNECDSFQLVFNLLNQRSLQLIKKLNKNKKAIIVRMPLQFGLLSGRFNINTTFESSDHRSFRLNIAVLTEAQLYLKKIWKIQKKYSVSKTLFALSFISNYNEISTIIPGMRNEKQVIENSNCGIILSLEDRKYLEKLNDAKHSSLMGILEAAG